MDRSVSLVQLQLEGVNVRPGELQKSAPGCGNVVHIGLDAPTHRTKLRMLSPTCAQTCPSCAVPSSAQVRPKLGASELLFGPT